MKKQVITISYLLLFAAITAGCAASGGATAPETASAAPPPDYRNQVAARVRATFFDPYSIRDAAISEPIAGQSFSGPVSTVCMRANAKNRMGGYTGLKETAFTFSGGAISVVDSEYAALSCAKAVYGPFPEMQEASSPPPRKPRR